MRPFKPLAALVIAVGVLPWAPTAGEAQGEHARRAAAELLVLRGDIRRLADAKFTARQKKGLADRIGGLLAGLDLLMRLADQEALRPPRADIHRRQVATLRSSFEAGTLGSDDDALAGLIDEFPLDLTSLKPLGDKPAVLSDARRLHEELCDGCHDAPDSDVERPAYDLSEEAARLQPAEFAARLLIGVRGDRITGIDNPLSDAQIAGLIAFYSTAN